MLYRIVFLYCIVLYGHLATVRVVAEMHGWLPRGSVGVHTQRTPTLLTLPPTGSLHTGDIVVVNVVVVVSTYIRVWQGELARVAISHHLWHPHLQSWVLLELLDKRYWGPSITVIKQLQLGLKKMFQNQTKIVNTLLKCSNMIQYRQNQNSEPPS